MAGEVPAENSVYAALDSKDPNRMTVVAVNKTSSPKQMSIRIRGFSPKTARAFEAVYGSPFDPKEMPARVSAPGVEFTVPPLGVVTVELRR